jgi:hypothetical protein
MRRAKYSAKKVRLPNVPFFGFNVQHAKPGYWVTWAKGGVAHSGRVLGRIDQAEFNGQDREPVTGWLAVMALSEHMTHAFIRWIDPAWVTECAEQPPRALLDWITGTDWPTRGADVGRLIAMCEHGTTSEQFIATRDDPAKPYNDRTSIDGRERREYYIRQFILS